MLPILENEQLILRPLRESDAPAIYEYAQLESAAQWVAWDRHQSIDDTLHFIRKIAFQQYRDGCVGPYGIALKDAGDDLVIGTAGCLWSSRANAEMELGYILAPPFWGRGITTQACKLIIDHAFKTTIVNRIQSCVMPENLASKRVLEKLGFLYEGRMRKKFWRTHDAYFWDADYFSFLRTDWEQTT